MTTKKYFINYFHSATHSGHPFVPYSIEDTLQYIHKHMLFKLDETTLKFKWELTFNTPEYGFIKKCIETDIHKIFYPFNIGCPFNQVHKAMLLKWEFTNRIIKFVQQVINCEREIKDLQYTTFYNDELFTKAYELLLENGTSVITSSWNTSKVFGNIIGVQ